MTTRPAAPPPPPDPEVPADEVELIPTEEDQRLWEAIYGYTAADVETIARYVDVPEDKVTRMIEVMRMIDKLPRRKGHRAARHLPTIANAAFPSSQKGLRP